MELTIERATKLQTKPNWSDLTFGTTFTDHMFVMDYEVGKGWYDARIMPYQDLPLSPAAVVLHYGQTVFEGLKAYKDDAEEIFLFRPDENMKRMNDSCERLCMPTFDGQFVIEAMKQLIEIEQDWVPEVDGMALYIRPVMYATEAHLGVSPSKQYRFIILLSPVGSYYAEGINPVKIAVESQFVRAVKGGTGAAKTAGNYAAALKAQEVAEKEGYSQVLWLDGREQKYIEEVGAMNVFFKIDGKIVTPELNGSILPGITRKSVLQLLRHWEMDVEERRLSIDELLEAAKNGTLEEAFGTGTAAVISPIGELFYKGEKTVINNNEIGPVAKKIYDTITGIQSGDVEDPFGWRVQVI
ncbi:branched-chain amino acid aminotransferase [Savagea sp. SN6]|uniref:Branched-chain-amino-acid aminotransferase n=1 Tax=Savagea serpentis TaxID=2785297 RepID=A0A8J7GJ26_9BACL|nr:branched-chain amino acid aminotransferase [Savagea serpentis]MBF4500780.1 branched-chain amino acid aminotransferase [Savagea serpentis]